MYTEAYTLFRHGAVKPMLIPCDGLTTIGRAEENFGISIAICLISMTCWLGYCSSSIQIRCSYTIAWIFEFKMQKLLYAWRRTYIVMMQSGELLARHKNVTHD